jgi:hypothetical protein
VSETAQIRFRPEQLGSLHDLVADARTPLVWLLDADADPAEDALAALLKHAPGPAVSMPVDAAGQPIEPLIGRVADADDAEILGAIERRSLPLRHIALTSLLVERGLVLDLAPPDPSRFGWYAGAEWTARLFRRRRGLLVPASRVRVQGAPAGSPLQTLRVARAAGWRKGETAREFHRSVRTRLG